MYLFWGTKNEFSSSDRLAIFFDIILFYLSIAYFSFAVYTGRTLVVVNSSTLATQWTTEIKQKCRDALRSYAFYVDKKLRTIRPKKLAMYDMVITTYDIVNSEHKIHEFPYRTEFSTLFQVRLVLCFNTDFGGLLMYSDQRA